jgi:SAM-dependent methyltransferase
MNDSDKDNIINRYRNRLQQFGPGIKSLASGTVERRNIRFGLLSNVGELEGATILDIGSGLGDFYQYLKDRKIKVDYTGYDLSPDLISIAKEKFPEATFEVRDIQAEGIAGRYDYIVSSQTFNFRLANEDNNELIKTCLKISLESCNKGLCFDFITSYVDYREDHLFYYSPEELFTYAKSLTKRVSLSHESELFEFALYMFPDFVSWNPDRNA